MALGRVVGNSGTIDRRARRDGRAPSVARKGRAADLGRIHRRPANALRLLKVFLSGPFPGDGDHASTEPDVPAGYRNRPRAAELPERGGHGPRPFPRPAVTCKLPAMAVANRRDSPPDPLETGLAGLLAGEDSLALAFEASGAEGAGWLGEESGRWRALAAWGSALRARCGEVAEGLPWRAIAALGGAERELGERALRRHPALLARGVRGAALLGCRGPTGAPRVLWLEALRRPLPASARRRRLARALVTLEALAGRLEERECERKIAARARAVLAASHDLRHELSRAALEFERLRADPRAGAAAALAALRAARRIAGAPLTGGARCAASIPLAAMLSEELASCRAAVGGARVLLSCEPRLRARLDELALRRFVRNAVQNALRALASGGTVRVAARAEGALLRLSIEDDGRGMGAAEAQSLFAPGRSATPGGSGYGTTSLLEAARALEAELEVASATGRGTRVELRIPAAFPPAAAGAAAGDPVG